jgi:hypothetical protein
VTRTAGPAPHADLPADAIASTTAGLARSGVAELDLARSHRDALVAASAAVVIAAGHDPDVAACADAGCGLAVIATVQPDVCVVAHRLARLPDAPPAAAGPPLVDVLTDFLGVLAGVADAIRACRQIAHPGAGCWFSPVPGIDGCGEVLRLLHRCT